MESEKKDSKNLNVGNMLIITKGVTDFDHIAIHMVTFNQYKQIEKDYNGVVRRKMEVYGSWIENTPNASWESFEAILIKSGETKLASDVHRDLVQANDVDQDLQVSHPDVSNEGIREFPSPGRHNYYVIQRTLPVFYSFDRHQEYGIKLSLQDNQNKDHVTVELQLTSLQRSYQIPDCILVSPVLWVIIQGLFDGKLSIDFQHCAKEEHAENIFALKCINKEYNPPYQFVEAPDDLTYSTITTNLETVTGSRGCSLHVAAYTLALPSHMHLKYKCLLFSQSQPQGLIFTAVFIKNLISHKKKVLEICSIEGDKKLQDFPLEFEVSSNEVSIHDIRSVAGWQVTSHSDRVTKHDIEMINLSETIQELPKIVIECGRTRSSSPGCRFSVLLHGVKNEKRLNLDCSELTNNIRKVVISSEEEDYEQIEGQYMYSSTVYGVNYDTCMATFQAAKSIAGGEPFKFISTEHVLTLSLPISTGEWSIDTTSQSNQVISAEELNSLSPRKQCDILVLCHRTIGSNPLNVDVLINGVKKPSRENPSGEEAYFNITYDPSIIEKFLPLQSLLNDHIEELQKRSPSFPQIWLIDFNKALKSALIADPKFKEIVLRFHKHLWLFSVQEILRTSEKVLNQWSGSKIWLYLLYDSIFSLHSLLQAHQLIKEGHSPDNDVLLSHDNKSLAATLGSILSQEKPISVLTKDPADKLSHAFIATIKKLETEKSQLVKKFESLQESVEEMKKYSKHEAIGMRLLKSIKELKIAVADIDYDYIKDLLLPSLTYLSGKSKHLPYYFLLELFSKSTEHLTSLSFQSLLEEAIKDAYLEEEDLKNPFLKKLLDFSKVSKDHQKVLLKLVSEGMPSHLIPLFQEDCFSLNIFAAKKISISEQTLEDTSTILKLFQTTKSSGKAEVKKVKDVTPNKTSKIDLQKQAADVSSISTVGTSKTVAQKVITDHVSSLITSTYETTKQRHANSLTVGTSQTATQTDSTHASSLIAGTSETATQTDSTHASSLIAGTSETATQTNFSHVSSLIAGTSQAATQTDSIHASSLMAGTSETATQTNSSRASSLTAGTSETTVQKDSMHAAKTAAQLVPTHASSISTADTLETAPQNNSVHVIFNSPTSHHNGMSISSRDSSSIYSSITSTKATDKSLNSKPKEVKFNQFSLKAHSKLFQKLRCSSSSLSSLPKKSKVQKQLMNGITHEEFYIAQQIKMHHDPSKEEVIVYELIAMQYMRLMFVQM